MLLDHFITMFLLGKDRFKNHPLTPNLDFIFKQKINIETKPDTIESCLYENIGMKETINHLLKLMWVI